MEDGAEAVAALYWGRVSYQPDVLISTEGLYHTSDIWALTGGQTARDWPSLGEQRLRKEKRWMNGSAQQAELVQQLSTSSSSYSSWLVLEFKDFSLLFNIKWLYRSHPSIV